MADKNQNSVEFIGFDLGHGESAVARAYSNSSREPEILEYQGERSFVTAVAKDGKDIRIGAQAVNISAVSSNKAEIYLKFKTRDLDDPVMQSATKMFAQTLFKELTREKKIAGLGESRFLVGCPSGWSPKDRDVYVNLLQSSGLKHISVVPESRAALMTALEQGYLSLEDTRSSVLIIDIGSSTTDFTYCVDLEAEDIGHNILGSGLLDTLIFKRNLKRQSHIGPIQKLLKTYPFYQPIMEYWCRQVKEQFFNGDGQKVEMIKRLPMGKGVLFEISMDKADAKAVLDTPIKALNDYTWPATFEYALKEAKAHLSGRSPAIVLLTGGASRLPLIAPACEQAFPKSRVVRGAEPEFAIARGLSWLGRFEYLNTSFQKAIKNLVQEEGPIQALAHDASTALGAQIAPVLVDALIEACVIPAFGEWRKGHVDTLDEVEEVLDKKVQTWLASRDASEALRPVIEDWFAGVQRDIEKITDPLCRDHGLPAMVLSLDDSAHVARHLEGLNVAAPQVASLESDTAIAGTTISAILVGVLLAKANLLAPLLANPIGLAIGGVVGIGGFFAGRKALEGTMRRSKIPKLLRQLVTDGRIRRAANAQRSELIQTVAQAWDDESARRFGCELIAMLENAFLHRANERAVLFML